MFYPTGWIDQNKKQTVKGFVFKCDFDFISSLSAGSLKDNLLGSNSQTYETDSFDL